MILLTVAVLLAAVDARITQSRLQINPALELNPLVRWISLKCNPTVATTLGVWGVQSLVALILSHLSPTALAVFLGASLYRTLGQLLSLKTHPL